MNLKEFKQEIKERHMEEAHFAEFRIMAGNAYKRYSVYKKNIFEQVIKDEEREGKEKDWENIHYDIAINMYGAMGLEVPDDLRPKLINLKFDDVYAKICEFQDNIEYTYALLTVVKEINKGRALYNGFVKEIYHKLLECKLESCRKLVKHVKKGKAFVAMWFDKRMEPVRREIERAVEECGYIPVLIDEQEYNGQIMDRVYQEIDESCFVIAELTGGRNGVYYEAGYAEGKGKEVILCCMKGEERHFDLRQANTIFWGNDTGESLDIKLEKLQDSEKADWLEGLFDDLVKRIEETVGSY